MLALKLQAVLNSARDLAGKMGIDLKTIGTDASSAAPAAAPAGGKAPATGLKSQFVFDSIQNSIVQEGQKLVSQVSLDIWACVPSRSRVCSGQGRLALRCGWHSCGS